MGRFTDKLRGSRPSDLTDPDTRTGFGVQLWPGPARDLPSADDLRAYGLVRYHPDARELRQAGTVTAAGALSRLASFFAAPQALPGGVDLTKQTGSRTVAAPADSKSSGGQTLEAWQIATWALLDQMPMSGAVEEAYSHRMSRLRLAVAAGPSRDTAIECGPDSDAYEAATTATRMVIDQAERIMRAVDMPSFAALHTLHLRVAGAYNLVLQSPAGWADLTGARWTVVPWGGLKDWHKAHEADGPIIWELPVTSDDPRKPGAVTSPLRKMTGVAQEVLEVLRALGMGVRQRYTLAGILGFPSEALPPKPNGVGAQKSEQQTWLDVDKEADPEYATNIAGILTAVIARSTAAPGSPESATPIPIVAPGEALKNLRIITTPDLDPIFAGVRDNALERFRQSYPCPVERISGLGQSKYDNAAAIYSDEYTAYLQGYATQAAELWTDIVRTFLVKMGVAADVAGLLFVIPDPSDIVAERDVYERFKELFDVGAISWSALRRSAGASEDDAPSPDEQALRLALGGTASPDYVDAAVKRFLAPWYAGAAEAPPDVQAPTVPALPAGDSAVTAAGRRKSPSKEWRSRLTDATHATTNAILDAVDAALTDGTDLDVDAVEGALAHGLDVTVAATRDLAVATGRVALVAAAGDDDDEDDDDPDAEDDDEEDDDGLLLAIGAPDGDTADGWRTLALGVLAGYITQAAATAKGLAPWMVRSVMAVAAGTPIPRTRTGNYERTDWQPADLGGWGTSDVALTILTTVGLTSSTPQYTWEHGDPARPYEPHEDLDGVTFSSWDDDALAGDPIDGGGYYYPGDHDGCTCAASLDTGSGDDDEG